MAISSEVLGNSPASVENDLVTPAKRVQVTRRAARLFFTPLYPTPLKEKAQDVGATVVSSSIFWFFPWQSWFLVSGTLRSVSTTAAIGAIRPINRKLFTESFAAFKNHRQAIRDTMQNLAPQFPDLSKKELRIKAKETLIKEAISAHMEQTEKKAEEAFVQTHYVTLSLLRDAFPDESTLQHRKRLEDMLFYEREKEYIDTNKDALAALDERYPNEELPAKVYLLQTIQSHQEGYEHNEDIGEAFPDATAFERGLFLHHMLLSEKQSAHIWDMRFAFPDASATELSHVLQLNGNNESLWDVLWHAKDTHPALSAPDAIALIEQKYLHLIQEEMHEKQKEGFVEIANTIKKRSLLMIPLYSVSFLLSFALYQSLLLPPPVAGFGASLTSSAIFRLYTRIQKAASVAKNQLEYAHP